MKNIIRLISILLTLAMASSITSCFIQPQEKLASPTLSLSGSTIHWGIVDDADSYNIYINSELKDTVTATRYILVTLPAGEYIVEVSANRGNEESEKSNSIKYIKEDEIATKESNELVSYVSNGTYDYTGIWGSVTDMVTTRQLMDRQLWADFVNQFRSPTDVVRPFDENDENGCAWRGEFWGKLMMSAVATYHQTHDQELYDILEETTIDLLTTQTPDGRISSYERLSEGGVEFDYWDVWNRKYTIMGCLAFYEICQDEALKARLVDSMLGQFDYLATYVGPGEDQIDILESGRKYGGLAAASILEAIVALYKVTGEQRVYDYAKYVADSGGSRITNLIEDATLCKELPYQWGTPKAYELCSYFKGVLDFYTISGEEKYLIAGLNAAYAILETEVVITGGAGYNSEEFNHSVIEQSNPENTKANLETCVTVMTTLFFDTAYRLSGDTCFIDSIEKTMYNQLLSAVDKEEHYEHAFTSYFNLMFSSKTTSAAGGLSMAERSYGCCIVFGGTGTGNMHKLNYNVDQENVYANLYIPGTVTFDSPSGTPITFITETNYPSTGTIKITINSDELQMFPLKLRIPEWSEETSVSVNGVAMSDITPGEYYTIAREWKNGDEIVLSFDMRGRLYYGSEECRNENGKNNVAVIYGPVVLARDARLGENIFQTVNIALDEDGYVKMKKVDNVSFDTIAEVEVELQDGSTIKMVDYASSGGTYNEESVHTVFMPITDYWDNIADLNKKIVLISNHGNMVIGPQKDGMIANQGFSSDYEDLSEFAVQLVNRGDGYYSISFNEGKVVTCVQIDGKWRFQEQEYTGADTQLFKLSRISIFNFKIVSKVNGQLFSIDTDSNLLHLYNDCSADAQKWRFINVD